MFYVPHNPLLGPISLGRWFDAFDYSSFDGNQGLCEILLSKKCGNMQESPLTPPSVTSIEEEDSDVID